MGPSDLPIATTLKPTARRRQHSSILLVTLLVLLAGAAFALTLTFRGRTGGPVVRPLPRYTKLVWSDEFNGPAGTPPPASKWTHDVGAWGYTEHELETYTNSPANASLDGHGHLAIVARRQTAAGPDGRAREYTSARLETSGLFSADHGLIEIRTKVPAGAGLWPAFWLLGADANTAGWPAAGEIDVIEALDGNPFLAHGFINGPSGGARHYTLGHTRVSATSLINYYPGLLMGYAA
jgi:beta-glucanase (GH16 family)